MSLYRNALPQLGGQAFITDGGLETLIRGLRCKASRMSYAELGGYCGTDHRHIGEICRRLATTS